MFYLARHGETPWSMTRQHTGLTDLQLTPKGKQQARALQSLLRGINFTEVWTSPLIRARETCALAGFSDRAESMQELVEWNYGDYEGLLSSEIRKERPDWNVFIHGAPGGESPGQVQARVQCVMGRMKKAKGSVLMFSSAHIMRALTAYFLFQDIGFGRNLCLNTASLSILGYEHGFPVIQAWNWVKPFRWSNL